MLPVCNRPIVDYIVEECILNGVTDIYFVVSPEHDQLETYYGQNRQLEQYLKERGKDDLLVMVAPNDKARFHYIVQTAKDPYGTAVPVWLAKEAVASDEQFAVVTGDDFLFAPKTPGINLRNMLKIAEEFPAAILATEMSPEKVALYGAIKTRPGKSGAQLFESIVEKPAPGTAPTNLVNVSKYMLPQGIFPFIEETMKTPSANGEHYLTEAVNAYVAAGNDMAVVRAVGQYLDGGNLPGWIEANNIVFAAQASAAAHALVR